MIMRVELSTMSDSALSLYSMLDTVVISGEYVCWCLALWLVCWCLVLSVISCHLCSSVYECQRVECAFTFPVRTGCGMFVMCCL